MRLPSYPQYKDSGESWLGPVPSHWQVKPCRYFVEERTEKNEGAANQNYLSLMANVGIIPYEEKGDVGNKKPEDLGKCKLVEKGDLVINSMNYGIGSYGLSSLAGVCSPVYIVLRPRLDRIRDRFAFRVFENRAFQTHAQSFGNGILEHRAAINWDILKGIHVGLPPLHEQEAILSFLDRETAKIDALIAEQEKLIALLAEKRQATISHAVTRGLNPNAPMKDSGVAWLGKVPGRWVIRHLKTISTFTTSGPRGWSDRIAVHGSLFIQSGDLNDSLEVDFANAKRVAVEDDAEATRTRLVDGDVVVCITGAKTGNVAVCLDVPEPAYVNQHLCLVRPNIEVLPTFLGAVLTSTAGQLQFALAQYGLKQGLSLENVRELLIPLPSLDEQQAIVTRIGEEVRKLDTLTAEATSAIALLKERRSALIAAAVTGQIDVRQA